jgi:hypothetical protein
MKGGGRRMRGEKWKIGLMALLILTATLITTVNILVYLIFFII